MAQRNVINFPFDTDAKGSSPGGYVQLIHERFPHVREISLQLLMQQEVFRELCEEYEACHHATERLASNGSDENMLKEYSALRLRLEGELLKYMSQHKGDAAS